MKALSGVNEDIINDIVSKRPFSGIVDFMNRCKIKKPAMISLIKSGAFDNYDKEWAEKLNLETRKAVMIYYCSQACEPKTRLTLQNFNGLIEKGVLPKELDFQKNVFYFNKALKSKKIGQYFVFTENNLEIYLKYFDPEHKYLQIVNEVPCVLEKDWKKIYDKQMDIAREWIKVHQTEMLNAMNGVLFKETWDKYAKGNISSWEMDSLCFYYHEHELKHINKQQYGVVNFFNLPTEPEVEKTFKRGGRDIPLFKISSIVGTVIGKNDTRSSISLLTPDGVVTVKFTREYYAMYKKRISDFNEEGKKKVMEEGWFRRGVKLMVSGFRRDDMFISKVYNGTGKHQLYQIMEIDEYGSVVLEHDRYGMEGEKNV